MIRRSVYRKRMCRGRLKFVHREDPGSIQTARATEVGSPPNWLNLVERRGAVFSAGKPHRGVAGQQETSRPGSNDQDIGALDALLHRGAPSWSKQSRKLSLLLVYRILGDPIDVCKWLSHKPLSAKEGKIRMKAENHSLLVPQRTRSLREAGPLPLFFSSWRLSLLGNTCFSVHRGI